MKEIGKCFHFRGVQHKTCDAGILMESVRDVTQPGPYRWPCITFFGQQATTTCPNYREPTAEEIAADEAAFARVLERMRENARKGICNECGAKTTSVRQSGSCVYADPCGHRIGQGDAKQVAKSMNVAVRS